ncbi:hypothetical protein HDU76_006627, partial [Blyttiomyces sp. JEL0837]
GAFSSYVPKTCQYGYVCCADTGKCAPANQCSAVLPKAYSDTAFVPTHLAANVPTNICDGITDGHIACVNPSYFAICKAGLPAIGLQPCPSGTKCCNNQCASVYDAVCDPSGICANTDDNAIACTSDNQFVKCLGKVPITSPETCAKGTVCCGGACVFADNPICARNTTATTYTVTGVVSGTSTKYVATSLVYTTPATYTSTTLPKPTYVPVAYGSCVGVKDNNIVCRSKTTFNYCLNEHFVSSPDQSCADGTVCCPGSQTCTLPNQCYQTLLSSPCNGLPDGATVCTSGTSYQTCKKNDYFAPTSTACPSGTICCGSTNSCVNPAYCTNPYGNVLQNPGSLGITYGDPTNVCSGIADSSIACLNPSQFTTCNHGLPVGVQSCPLGTKCCGNSCSWPDSKACQSNVCLGVKDGAIACTSDTAFTQCLGGIGITAPTQCPANMVCCGNACTYSTNQLCASNPGPAYYPVPVYNQPNSTCTATYNGNPVCQPYVVTKTVTTYPTPTNGYVAPPPYTNPCKGVSDHNIVCRTQSTFNYCLNSQLVNALDQSCPYGTVCCTATTPHSCTYPGQCKATLSSVCSSIPNNNMVCLSNSTYGVCWNGMYADPVPQPCPYGTTCCADQNKCLPAGQCGYVLPPPVTYVPQINPVPATNVCAYTADNANACVNPSQYTICKGGVAAYAAMPCPAGTVCCGGSCVNPYDSKCSNTCVGLYCNNVCSGIADTATACSSANSIVTCLHGVPFTAPTPCAKGTVCCGNACVMPSDPSCGPNYKPVPTYLPPPPVYSSTVVAPTYTAAPAPTTGYVAPVPTNALGSCAGVADYTATCISANTYKYCLGGAYIPNQQIGTCGAGLICCPSTGLCDASKNCPSYGGSGVPVTGANTCATAPAGTNVCNGVASYNVCLNGAVLATQNCPKGTVCCPTTGTCTYNYQCPAIAGLPGYGSSEEQIAEEPVEVSEEKVEA